MKLKGWMQAKSIIEALFGVGFVLVPASMLSVYGVSTDDGGLLMSRLFGTTFIFGAILLWLASKFDGNEVVRQALVPAVTISNAIGFVVCLVASLGGVWNAMGWLSVGLFLVFGVVFATFWFGKSPA